jgi:hypothetical protein
MLIFLIYWVIASIAIWLISNYFRIPLPFSGNKKKEIGIVTKIECLNGIYEVTVQQWIEVPKLQNELAGLVSASIGSFIHFRKWQRLPKIGGLIEADVIFYYFELRDESFSFVQAWKYVKEIPESRKTKMIVRPIYGHIEGMSDVM